MPEPHPPTVRRLGWLHFANDFTIDAVTPLLPAGVPVAWLGVMEGLADAVGQVLKLLTGRMSDAQGRRVPWVRAGYAANAVARPLTAVGLWLSWPLWIVACRVADRVGKGLRGAATDALVADWTEGGARVRAYALMRTQDHLGATAGALCAAGVAWWLHLDAAEPQRIAWVVAALILPMMWMLWLCRGLSDAAGTARPAASVAGWWPTAPVLRRPLLAIAVASLGARLAPLLILAHVTGLAGDHAAWPIWQACLAWGALALIQAAAASAAGSLGERVGARQFVVIGWLVGAAVFAGLAVAHGPWLVAAGAAWGVMTGLTEGTEKAWLADLAPKSERGLAFGALGLVAAGTALLGSGAVGWLLHTVGAYAFLLPAAALAVGSVLAFSSAPAAPSTRAG